MLTYLIICPRCQNADIRKVGGGWQCLSSICGAKFHLEYKPGQSDVAFKGMTDDLSGTHRALRERLKELTA